MTRRERTGSTTLLLLSTAGVFGLVAAAEKPLETSLVEYVKIEDESLPASNTIATKLPLPVERTPFNVGTVGRALIDEQGAWSLGEALPNVSGLNVQSGSGTFDYFSIRGFDVISSGLVMFDGAAEPEAGYYPLYNVRGVEVLKGPAGVLYGSNPLGGAVNLVRKQPESEDFLGARGSLGSFDTKEASLDWNLAGSDGGPNFRINAMRRESDGYRDGREGRDVAVNPAVSFRTSGRTTLTFNAEYVQGDHAPDSGLPVVYSGITGLPDGVADVSRRRSYQSAGDFSEQTLGRFQLDHETRIDERLTLRTKTYLRGLDWRTDGTILSGAFTGFGPAPHVSRDLGVLDDRQQFVGSQFEALLTLGSRVEHRLLAGLEVARTSDKFRFDVLPLADVDINLQPTAFDLNPNPFPLTSMGDVTNVVIAPYVVDQMKLSPRVEVLAGARYDHIDQDGDVQPLSFLPAPTMSYSRDDSEISPMLGIVVAPQDDLSLYASASRAHAPPSTRLVEEADPASREPEQGTQFEVGVRKQSRDGRVRTTIAAYRIDRENIAIMDAFFITQQSGDQRSTGLEVELAAQPAPGLHTFLASAWNDSELTHYTPCVRDGSPGGCTVRDFSGNTPILAPKHMVHAWFSKVFKSGLGFGGGARYIGEQYLSEDNLMTLDSALTFDASVFYDLPRWRLKLDARNLTGAENDYRGIGGANSVVPADASAVFFGVECRM